MPALYLAPPASGKTEYTLVSARAQSLGLARQPIIVFPTPVQVRSARARLAKLGGAMAIRLFTFDDFYAWILKQSQNVWVEPNQAALAYLMRQTLAELAKAGDLPHFGTIAHMQGLADLMRDLVGELENALIDPADFLTHIEAAQMPARLADLARVYHAWQTTLAERNWVDRIGVGWRALAVLRADTTRLLLAQTPFYFDGFDFLTELQVQTIATLAQQPNAEVTVTLTGELADTTQRTSTRFIDTRHRLEEALGVAARALEIMRAIDQRPAALRRLYTTIIAPSTYESKSAQAAEATDDNSFVLLEATQRSTEIRAALRWLKRAIVQEGIAPKACALLVRDRTAYMRPVAQVAAEFGIPIAIEGGAPLADHTLIAYLAALLEAVRPDGSAQPTLRRTAVIDLWQSPWLDLDRLGAPPNAPDLLDAISRRALLISGVDGWQRALAHFEAVDPTIVATKIEDSQIEEAHSDETGSGSLPSAAASTLRSAFASWLGFVTPPPTASHVDYITWLQTLIAEIILLDGVDPTAYAHALSAFFNVMRGMQWADHLETSAPTLTFDAFVRQLRGALDSALYQPPAPPNALFVGTIVQARGIPFAAVAICGLAEGELPQRTVEDPILRQADRLALRAHFPGIQPQPVGMEREYFEEALSRADERLLLTRPLLTDTGVASEPSPYWLDVRAALDPPLQHERAGFAPNAEAAASLVELLRTVAVEAESSAPARWTARNFSSALRRLRAGGEIVTTRTRGPATPYDGNLHSHRELMARHFPPERIWSPTGLEMWIACHHHFFAARMLGLEAADEPETGVARWQVGEIYHAALQEIFDPAAGISQPEMAVDDARVEATIDRHISEAPTRYGFLDAPLWRLEAREIALNLRRTVTRVAALPDRTTAVELRFSGADALRLDAAEGEIRVRGAIDRVDLLPTGGYRLMDYKSGVGGYSSQRPLAEGKKLQLALYALAFEQNQPDAFVEDALYFFVHKGEPANWSLATFPGGKEAAFAIAETAARSAVGGMRSGHFEPRPPDEGCPDYCPAAAWCWHFSPRR